jgi:hypothetical protein
MTGPGLRFRGPYTVLFEPVTIGVALLGHQLDAGVVQDEEVDVPADGVVDEQPGGVVSLGVGFLHGESGDIVAKIYGVGGRQAPIRIVDDGPYL